MAPAPSPRRAAAALAAATALWGLSFPLVRALTLALRERAPGVSTWSAASVVVALRFLVGGAALAALSPRSLRAVTRAEWAQGVGLGVLCGVGIPWQVDGLAHTHASVSAFISQGYCVWIPAWLCVSTRRAPPRAIALATALALAGIVAIAGAELGALRVGRGEFETLVASLVYAAQVLWLERPRYRENRSATITVVMFAVTGLIAVPLALAAGGGAAPWAQLAAVPRLGAVVVALAVLCTTAPFLMMNHFQRHVGAAEAGLIYCAEPLFASALALFAPALLAAWMGVRYPNEAPTARLAAGAALITAANLVVQARKGRAEADARGDRS